MPIVHAFAAKATGLYILVSPRTLSPPQLIIHLDHAGTVKGSFVATHRVERDWIDVDDKGFIYVLRRYKAPSGISAEYLVFDTSGRLMRTVPTAPDSVTSKIIGDQIASLSRNGTVRITDASSGSERQVIEGIAKIDLSVRSYLFPLPEKQIAAIESRTGTASVIDTMARAATVVKYAASDVASSLATYPQPKTALVVSDVTTDEQNNVYLNLSGIRLVDGAMVVMVTPTGEVVRKFRCRLPKVAEFSVAGNPDGYLAPALIGVRAGRLFVVDKKGRLAVYRIPRP